MPLKSALGYATFRLGAEMRSRKILGGWRLLNTAQSLGLLGDRTYSLSDKINVTVPLARIPLTHEEVLAYDNDVILGMAGAITRPAVFVDCGADIGLMSCKIAAVCPFIQQVLAIEPNQDGFRYASANLKALPISAQAFHAAIGRSSGKGRLILPPHATHYTGACIVLDPAGDIDVLALDSLNLPATLALALKIDVEGFEYDVIAGALESIRRAPEVVVCLEAHHEVMQRAGDLIETLRLLQSIRPFRFTTAEPPNHPIDLTRPVTTQLPFETKPVYNVLAISTRA